MVASIDGRSPFVLVRQHQESERSGYGTGATGHRLYGTGPISCPLTFLARVHSATTLGRSEDIATVMTRHKSLWPTVGWKERLEGHARIFRLDATTQVTYWRCSALHRPDYPCHRCLPWLLSSRRYTNFLLAVHTVQRAAAEHRVRRVTAQRELVCGRTHKHRREPERGGRGSKDRKGGRKRPGPRTPDSQILF